MKKIYKIIITAVASTIALGGIGYTTYQLLAPSDSKETAGPITQREETIVEVDTTILTKGVFKKQVLCNGRLTAIRRAELQCPGNGTIMQSIRVKNGQRVAAGAILATADTRTKERELEKAKRDMEKARVDLQDKLIGLGYDGATTGVPAEVLHRAEVTSGFYSARYALQTAEAALTDCHLTAPFAGRIADLVARPHQRGEKFCTLIDDSYFDVEFQVLEAELASVRAGTIVQVSPFIDETLILSGTVTEVNPTITDKGLVSIKARIKNTSEQLMDGMNVKVIIENSVRDMFVVPKEAVVERDGYHVVFVYDTDTHRAVWTYVDILYSNLTSYAITGCERKETVINSGDIIITSGNLNLADDTEVKVVDSKK